MRPEHCHNRPSLVPLMRLTVLTAAGFLAAAALVKWLPGDQVSAAAYAAALTTLLAFGLPAWLTRKYSQDLKKSADLQVPRPNRLLAAALAALVLQPALSYAADLTRSALEHLLSPDRFLDLMQLQTERTDMIRRIAGPGLWGRFPMAVLSLALLPALCEELFFRVTLQTLMRRFIRSAAGTVAAVSAIFTAVHSDWINAPGIFLCSVLLGYSYLWSGKLWIAVVFHATSNLWNLLSLYAPDCFAGFSPGWSAAAGLPLAVALSRYAAGRPLVPRKRF